MCLSNRTPIKISPETTKTAYKVVAFSGSRIYGSYLGTEFKRGKWLKARNPEWAGFCVFQTKRAATLEAKKWGMEDETVVKVQVRKLIATGTFNGDKCWAAAEMYIPFEE